MSRPLWTWEEVRRAIGGEASGEVPETFSGVTFDSREVQGGEIFFAIRGVRMDGHAFVAAALKSGAALAVVSQPDDEMRGAGPLLVVDDTLQALRRLGAVARARVAGKVIGVTGSVGKTTTKDMLALALSAAGRTHAARASFNNHWGVPLTLARMPRDTEFGIIEMGMNAPGEIADLAVLVRPDVAVVTHVAESHIGAFGDLAGIARAKAEIFSGLAENGRAVINRDAPHYEILETAAQEGGAIDILTYGMHPEADIRLRNAASRDDCVCVEADAHGQRLVWRVGMPGAHIALNSLAVVGVALATGADLTAVLHRLADMRAPEGRGTRHRLRVQGGEILLIDESYNANPASMRAALAALSEASPGPGGRRIAVLGDMLELGERSAELHAGLAEAVDRAGVDALYVSGEMMRHLWEAAPAHLRAARVEDPQKLPDMLKTDLRAGDVVMIKGSLGSRMMPVARALREMFEPSREEV